MPELTPEARFQAALARFDEANAADPNRIAIDGKEVPYELFYAHVLTEWVLRLCPEAGEALRLAARCQHLCRWESPRSTFPANRAGYLQWRAELKKFHARRAGEILTELGFPPETIARVQALNLKRELGRDADMQMLEDALCLVTLEHQLGDLLRKNGASKLIAILRKTWRKMSPTAQTAALALDYAPEAKALLEEALAQPGESAP